MRLFLGNTVYDELSANLFRNSKDNPLQFASIN